MKQKGFTLIEMMIVVAILGILAVIAIPAYSDYLEKGYRSQLYAEMISVNNAFKQRILMNPGKSNAVLAQDLSAFVAAYKIDPKLAVKYEISGSFVDVQKGRAYRLVGVPKAGTGYKLSAWVNSVGEGYLCTDAASAKAFKTTLGSGSGCEAVSNRKK